MPSMCARTLPSAKETAGDETDKIPVSMELTFISWPTIYQVARLATPLAPFHHHPTPALQYQSKAMVCVCIYIFLFFRL